MTDKAEPQAPATAAPEETVASEQGAPQTATQPAANPADAQADDAAALKGPEQMPGEIGGPQGPEPTRYGDWEFKGRCSDF